MAKKKEENSMFDQIIWKTNIEINEIRKRVEAKYHREEKQ